MPNVTDEDFSSLKKKVDSVLSGRQVSLASIGKFSPELHGRLVEYVCQSTQQNPQISAGKMFRALRKLAKRNSQQLSGVQQSYISNFENDGGTPTARALVIKEAKKSDFFMLKPLDESGDLEKTVYELLMKRSLKIADAVADFPKNDEPPPSLITDPTRISEQLEKFATHGTPDEQLERLERQGWTKLKEVKQAQRRARTNIGPDSDEWGRS